MALTSEATCSIGSKPGPCVIPLKVSFFMCTLKKTFQIPHLSRSNYINFNNHMFFVSLPLIYRTDLHQHPSEHHRKHGQICHLLLQHHTSKRHHQLYCKSPSKYLRPAMPRKKHQVPFHGSRFDCFSP